MHNSPESGPRQLGKLLSQFIQDGGFSICVLTDQNGLPIASASQNGHDPDRQAAVMGLIQRNVAAVAAQGLGFAMADEIAFNYDQGQRLICKFFKAGNHDLILALTVADRNKTYRRLTRALIGAIRQTWQQYWG
jgi:hypothetical protein